MIVKIVELLLLVALALISDIRTYKIKNVLIVAFLTAGLATNLALDGLSGLLGSILAAALPIPLLIVFYAARMLGAGDLKLFCAAGAIAGIGHILYVMAYSFIAGGAIALIIMLVNRNFRSRAAYLVTYLKTCFLTRSMKPYSDFDDKSDGAKFRFSYAVACGVALFLFRSAFRI